MVDLDECGSMMTRMTRPTCAYGSADLKARSDRAVSFSFWPLAGNCGLITEGLSGEGDCETLA